MILVDVADTESPAVSLPGGFGYRHLWLLVCEVFPSTGGATWKAQFRADEAAPWVDVAGVTITAAGMTRFEGSDAGHFRLTGPAGARIRVLPSVAAVGGLTIIA